MQGAHQNPGRHPGEHDETEDEYNASLSKRITHILQAEIRAVRIETMKRTYVEKSFAIREKD